MSLIKKIFNIPSVNRDLVITMDSMHGSGAYRVAKIISEKLNINVYDEEIIELKTLEGRVNPENMTKEDSFLQGTIFDLYKENYSYSQENFMSNDATFLANSKTIRDYAKEGSCIIIGKCANYVLKDYKDTLNVFLSADEEYRIESLMKNLGYSREKATIEMNKKDARRKNHYNKYSGGTWGASSDYDLCINSAYYSDEAIAKLILQAAELKINS